MDRKLDNVSLASRGKKKISKLNPIFMAAISKAPQSFMKARLGHMIREKAPTAPKALVNALVDHVLNNVDQPFTWDSDNTDGDVEIVLSNDDIQPIIDDTLAFIDNDIPKITTKIIEKSAKRILKSLHADWPAQHAHDEARMVQFRLNLQHRWGDAFESLRMLYTIAVEIGAEHSQRLRRSRSTKKATLNDTLVRLHARGCQVALEIITLLENGLADGAMARWRTLHEICVVTNVLVAHGEEIAIRYRAHEAVEAKRAMDRFVLHHKALGYRHPSKREIAAVERDFRLCLAAYGDGFGSEYGWAAHHLGLKKPRLVDLEKVAGRSSMNSYYRMASYNVHAGATGIAHRLGLLDGIGTPNALAGASNAGFTDPAVNMAYDLVHLTAFLTAGRMQFDRLVELKILLLIRDTLPKKLRLAQLDLERAHQAEQKIAKTKANVKRRNYADSKPNPHD